MRYVVFITVLVICKYLVIITRFLAVINAKYFYSIIKTSESEYSLPL